MAYTVVLGTLYDYAELLLHEDAQRGASGLNHTMVICQRLGIADLRGR